MSEEMEELSQIAFSADPALTEEYYAAIGRFIARFSTMELMLKACIARMVSVEPHYRDAVFAEMTVASAIRGLRTASQIFFTEDVDRKKFDALASSIHGVNMERIVIAHATWYETEKGIAAYKAGGEYLKLQSKYYDIADLYRVIEKLTVVQRGLDELFLRVVISPPSARR